MRFDGDIIITDPCYLIKDEKDNNGKDDWHEILDFDSEEVADLSKLGFKNYLCRNTIYGDWSCTTIEKSSEKVLGKFCADAGLVCVVLLDEVLKYNPKFDYHITKPWTTTLIKDFHGEISIEVVEGGEEPEVRVIGKGNINFYTSQTGF